MLVAERNISITKINYEDVQRMSFHHLFSTGTKKTYDILAEVDPIQAYKDYVLGLKHIEDEYIYDEDDVLCEDPIGKKIVDRGKEHIEMIDTWVDEARQLGYDVFLEAI